MRKNIAFIDVDTQNDFMNKTGSLYVPGAEDIKENIRRVTQFALDENVMILATMDSHKIIDAEISDNPDYIKTFPAHCIVGTPGHMKIAETYFAYGSGNMFKFYKSTFDVFDKELGNPHFGTTLEKFNIEQAVVYGVSTEICVEYAVNGLLDRGIRVLVVKDAIAGINEENVNKTLESFRKRGVFFIKSTEL